MHSSPEAHRKYQDTLHSIPRNGGDLVDKPLNKKGERLAHMGGSGGLGLGQFRIP